MNYYYITGTSKGIGKAIAELLLKNDSNTVYGIARGNSIKHPRYHHFSIDLSNIEKAADFKFENHAAIEKIVLINNAGTLGEVKYLGNLSNEAILSGYNINLVSPTLLMNNFIKTYKNHSAEKIIINVSSGAAQSPYDGWSVYCSCKTALDMLSKVGAKEQELNPKNPFYIFAVAPGVVDTYMQEVNRAVDVKDFSRKQKFIELKEQGQLAKPETVAQAFLKIIDNPSSVKEVVSRIQT